MTHPLTPRFSSLSRHALRTVLLLGAIFASASCKSEGPAPLSSSTTLTLGAYTTPREAYGVILPAFNRAWQASHQQELKLQESYLGSGAQARAILGGFEADVAALSLEPDIDKLAAGGLITHDWKAGPHGGMVTRSIVVIGVRQGNPKQIKDWADLAKDGVEVLTPNVRTSGGAMWNVAAIYGAGLRGHAGVPAGDVAAAEALLGRVLKNVRVMDSGARESLLNFERGVGDAIITYENEILVGKMKGQTYDYVVPTSTILIENPAALIDVHVDRHGNRAAAEAFVAFLAEPEAQRAFAAHGLRAVLPAVAQETAGRFPVPADLFSIADLGGWPGLQNVLFAEAAAYDRALALARKD